MPVSSILQLVKKIHFLFILLSYGRYYIDPHPPPSLVQKSPLDCQANTAGARRASLGVLEAIAPIFCSNSVLRLGKLQTAAKHNAQTNTAVEKVDLFFFPCKHFKASLRREVVIVFLGKGKSHGCRNHQLSTQCVCVWSISVKAGLFGFSMARDGIGFGKVYILISVSS